VVEVRHGAVIDLQIDSYWLVETDERFSLDGVPTPGVGDVSDDADELEDMVSRLDEDLTPWHELKHLIGLLEALVLLDRPAQDGMRSPTR
jgi:hypothetical protein